MIKIVLYGLSFIAYIGCLSSFPSLSSILLLISAILLLPVDEVKYFLLKIFKVKNTILSSALAVIILFVGILLTPINSTPQTQEQPLQPEYLSATHTPFIEQTPTVELSPQSTVEPTITPTVEVTPTPTPATTPVLEATPAPTIVPSLEVKQSYFKITFIDVGQGDASFIECDGEYMLIDGGTSDKSSLIYSFLKKRDIPKIDILVASHADVDHIGGLSGALNYTIADVILCPVTTYDTDAFNDFKRYVDKNGGGITVPNIGDTYTLGSSKVSILGLNAGNGNNASIVLKIQYRDTSFLFTGDAEREAEQAILNRDADLSATVLKVGHHGSDTSTTYLFLREIMPEIAIVSVGDNSYGHPTDNTLSRLRDADAKVYRTDIQGDIVCFSDGKTVTVSVEKNADADTLSAVKTTPNQLTVHEQNQKVQSSQTVTETTYVLNTNTHKFHYQHCSNVGQIKDSNKAFHSGTRDAVISMGYKPCKKCNP